MANLKRTREDILESVLSTVHRQGLNATSLNELLAVSGTSSGSFYNYFRSKHELGHALIDYEWLKIQENILEPAQAQCENPIAQVFWMIKCLESKQIDQPECDGCLLGNLIVDVVEQDESFREHLNRVFDLWEEAITQRLQAGDTQLKSHVDPTILAEQIITIMEGVMLLGRLRRNPIRIRRGFDSVRHLLKSSLNQPVNEKIF